ncbi:MAG: glycosyltransferase family 39 protein [Opitutaceae bacterium]|jgi:4-amino-4-deoxy-L-arabinose transferase-like glycosyltransferase|nr:glycosyltransferase family 39 protein [Opitutaceae bacterium]
MSATEPAHSHEPNPPATEKYPRLAVGLLLAVFAFLLFFRLGHYALWDDEAVTAFQTKALLQGGDISSATVDGGKNMYGYDANARILHKGRNVHAPPLPPYVVAPFVLLFGQNETALRLPFALCGLLSVIALLWGLWRFQPSRMAQVLACLALIGNVSLILHCRSARYYSLALLFSILVVICYLNRNGGRRFLIGLSLASIGLFASNVVNFAMLFGTLAVDYAVFERRRLRGDWRRLVAALAPAALVCGMILSRFNPLLTQDADRLTTGEWSLLNHAQIWLYRWRDLSSCEFIPGALALASLAVAVWKKDRPLLRAWLCALVYCTIAALAATQQGGGWIFTDVRHVVPLIALFVFISVRTLLLLTRGRWCFALPLALLAFGTNLLSGGPLLEARFPLWPRVLGTAYAGKRAPDSGDLRHGLRSTLADYLCELADARVDPYRLTRNYIDKNIPENALVWVLPWYCAHALVPLSPGPVYGWQLQWPPREDLKHLSEKFYMGRVPPDYIICFGPVLWEWLVPTLQKLNSPQMNYERVAVLDCYWLPTHRPELFWRTFKPVKGYDPNIEGIHILKRVPPPPPAPTPPAKNP